MPDQPVTSEANSPLVRGKLLIEHLKTYRGIAFRTQAVLALHNGDEIPVTVDIKASKGKVTFKVVLRDLDA